jgi:hypothetical protein
MKFITMLDVLPGKRTESVALLKNPLLVEGIEDFSCCALFGHHDFYITFSAPDEKVAADFVIQFRDIMHSWTALCIEVNKI